MESTSDASEGTQEDEVVIGDSSLPATPTPWESAGSSSAYGTDKSEYVQTEMLESDSDESAG